jgi:aspartate aminotransferase-like enzyme
MYIRKQRLLTPGPTPLYPPALHAMMASDIHHRTEDFRKIYRSCLADLKEVLGTSHDLLMFAASGTGAMDAAVSNLFSKGDKVIVCSAGKFGERWAEIAKAYGLDATVLTAPYGEVVTPERVEAALASEPWAALSQRLARSSWWMPLPAWAPCRSTSTDGGWMWPLAARRRLS